MGDDWRTVDRRMRRLAARRSALDAEALVRLGFRRDEAAAWVARAAAHVGGTAPLEELITAALRESGRPRS